MESLWSEEKAKDLEEFELLVYRSNLLGRDPGIVNRGGGNTSMKRQVRDFKGDMVDVLTVKGTGADLRTITKAGFADVALKDVLPLANRDAMTDEEMVDYLAHCLLEPNAPRPSIETLLHAFLPFRHIDHTHADAAVALCTTANGEQLMQDLFGQEAVWVPYFRPGFHLSKLVAQAVAANPKARFVFLQKHGLVAWGDTSKECYINGMEATTRISQYIEEKARGKRPFGGIALKGISEEARKKAITHIMPALRGALSSDQRVVLHYDDSPQALQFVNSIESRELAMRGLACPDHVLYTKVRPLFMDMPTDLADLPALEKAVVDSLLRYKEEYEAFFQRNRRPDDSMLETTPKVILAPGVGLITAGKDKRSATITAEFYQRAMEIMRGASVLGGFTSLTERESYDIEYWPLELYKLTLLPPEEELARRVAFITGAAGAIGRAIAQRYVEEGAQVVLADINAEGAQSVSEEINKRAGSPVSTAVEMDVTSESSTARAIEHAVVTYGGVDIVVANAGVAGAKPLDETRLEEWQQQMDVLVTGYFLTVRETLKIMKRQKRLDGACLGGNIVFISSKAALVPGRNAGAYGAAKAAVTHLARVLAEEAAPFGIRVNTIAPDAVIKGSGLWSGQWGRDRAMAHGIALEELEEFYRTRNLLKVSVTAEDVAEAALFFASNRSAKTTGGLLTVDGGLPGGFVR